MAPAKAIPIPSPESRWRLRVLGVVTVLCVTNLHRRDDATWPRVVVYKTARGEVESRSLSQWRGAAIEPYESPAGRLQGECQPIRQQDEFYCRACGKRWDVQEEKPCGGG